MFEQIRDSFFKAVAMLSRISGFGNISIKQIALFALLPFVALFIEMLIVGWKRSSLKALVENSKSAQGDWWCFFLTAFKVFDLIGLVLTFGIVYYLVIMMDRHFHLDLLLPISSVYVRGTLLFLISDLKNYVRHYCFHRYKWMWELHKYHHSADKFTMLTSLRGHFVEASVSRLFDAIPFVIFGSNPTEFVFINMLRETHQYFLHSQIRSDWGWIGRYILVSPAAHWMHHSVNSKHYNRNLGSTFIFWDLLFKSYIKQEPVIAIGLPESSFNKKGFFREQLSAYRTSLKRIISKSG